MEYIKENIDITDLSNYKTPARAKYYFEVESQADIDKLCETMSWAKKNDISVLFISGGTNMLFAFDVYNGLVIKNSLKWWTYDSKSQILETYGSESIWEIAQSLELDYGQNLWHRFIGLPGSIAGAIYWNAGCFGLETENNFLSCEVLDLENGQIKTFEKSDMDFAYRSSRIKKDASTRVGWKKYFIISAKFDLSQKIEKYHSDVDNIDFRENKQPKGNSCGSFFKNPTVSVSEFIEKFPEYADNNLKWISAWFLLEKAGCKWYTLWWAYFSEKHANFLMHNQQGTFQDMLDIISFAQSKVYEKFGIMLENEVQIISNS